MSLYKKHIITLFLLLVASIGTMSAWDFNHVQIGDLYYNLDSIEKRAEVTSQTVQEEYLSTPANYVGLTTVSIPSSVEYQGEVYNVIWIGSCAFKNSASLTSVVIPNSVINIGDRAFKNCTSLANINIPNSVTYISLEAFSNCPSLPVIDNIRYADTYLVEPIDRSLSSYTIRDGTRWIGDLSFDGCYNMTSISIPTSVTNIESYAFTYSGLISITIPASIINMDNRSFIHCNNMTDINVDPANPNYSSIDGVLFNKDKTEILRYPCGRQGAYTIPNSVTTIASQSFDGSIYLSAVTIPNSVTFVGEYAFMRCFALPTITFPYSVTCIERGVVQDDSIMLSINVDANNQNYCSIDGILFSKDQKTIIRCPEGRPGDYSIPDTVTHIEEGAFYSCKKLLTITVPENVINIKRQAFDVCYGLISITMEAPTPPTIEDMIFDGTNQHPIYVPCDAQSVYQTAWPEYADRIHPVGFVVTALSEDALQGLVEITAL